MDAAALIAYAITSLPPRQRGRVGRMSRHRQRTEVEHGGPGPDEGRATIGQRRPSTTARRGRNRRYTIRWIDTLRDEKGKEKSMHAMRWSLIVLLVASALAIVPRNAAHAITADACAASVTPTANVEPPKDTDFSMVANIVAAFNNARQQEKCTTPLSLDATAFQAASPQQQMLILLNAERVDRGLPALQLDTTLLSQIASNHNQEMLDYHYFGHASPLHNGLFDKAKLSVDPLLANRALAENIFGGGIPPAAMVYGYMYKDAGSSWGHRRNILGSATWVGIGLTSTSATTDNTLDFLADSPDKPYTPPDTADTTSPALDAPTITNNPAGGALTVQVTNVGDGDSPDSVGDVVGVVFYLGGAMADGKSQTVAATQSQDTPGTWTASLPPPAGGVAVGTLHAVAVDGSGNYMDCAAGAGRCVPTYGDMKPPTMKPSARPRAPRHQPAPCHQPAPHHQPAPCHQPAPPRPHASRPLSVDTPRDAGVAARPGRQ